MMTRQLRHTWTWLGRGDGVASFFYYYYLTTF
jgi:hypothetical protein